MSVIWGSLNLRLPDHQMFWSACSLGYFGFLRASEFTVPNLSTFSASLHLSVHDIAVDSSSAPSSMRVRIKGSKTDPFRKGCFVHIGLSGHPLCTVQAMMSSYLASRADAPGPLFLFTNGQPLTRTNLTDWLRQIMASAQIPGNFSSHSFRIGAATIAARNGVPDHLKQTMGRWSSNAYQLYIRTPADLLAALSLMRGSFQGLPSLRPGVSCGAATSPSPASFSPSRLADLPGMLVALLFALLREFPWWLGFSLRCSEVPGHLLSGPSVLQALGNGFSGWFPLPGLPWISPLCCLQLAPN